MDKEDLRWYLVTLKDGKVISAVVTAERQEGSKTFVYIRAKNEFEAKRVAYNQYCRNKLKEQRRRNQAAGLCRCGRKRSAKLFQGKPQLRCDVCLIRDKEHKRACLARKAGTAEPEQAKPTQIGERHRSRKDEVRLEVLLEVQAAWVDATNNGRFSSWLKEQVEILVRKGKAA